jgi:hypothetical protein
VLVARHEHGLRGGGGEGDHVVVARIRRADGWVGSRIGGHDRRGRQPAEHLGGVLLGDPSAQLRVGERASELLQQSGRPVHAARSLTAFSTASSTVRVVRVVPMVAASIAS